MSSNNQSTFEYQGEELDEFFLQKNWRNYVSSKIQKHIKGKCLEVGPGLGYFTEVLLSLSKVTSLTLVEPDKKHTAFLEKEFLLKEKGVVLHESFFSPNLLEEKVDTILLMDVLEHIEDDKGMLMGLSEVLSEKGKMILLLPAHMFLYSEFDKSIGHYRRYDRESLYKAVPNNCEIISLKYLDSVGMLASFFARATAAQPKRWQLWFWDKIMVPCSRLLDLIFCYQLGKSMVVILKKGNRS